ncbi:hypothetical protein [Pseudoduganella namucuonensis]|uniref:hypothetical protein n=1 Tax=Pseudoduganella namucuonensis TaxID=1035707 RepID=UPI0015A6E973|nr:hypothetical protein [Pseudoduganella namucuonensis]
MQKHPYPPYVSEAGRAPGTNGLWTFLFIDMIIFLLIFFTFMSERLSHAGQYTRSQLQLNELFGFANTLILLTSSWMVVEAGRHRSDACQRKCHAGWDWRFCLDSRFP